MNLIPISVSPDQLLVDPNNPRYFDLQEHHQVDKDRYAEEVIQVQAIAKLTNSYQVRDVRRSTLANGFINFEYIVVKDYPHATEKYVVIEGNRRLAAIQSTRQDYHRGVLPAKDIDVASTLESLQVLQFCGTEVEERIIQGIRHVAGPKEWQSYQQARLITALREVNEMDFDDIRNSLGLGPTVIRRLYNTSKAFEQMRQDDEFGDRAERTLFSLFLEMLRSPAIRDWLEWSDEELSFQSSTNRTHMYRMVVGEAIEDEDDSELQPVINNPQDMRTFGRRLSHHNKDRVLGRVVEGDLSIAQGWAIVEPNVTPWQETVADVVESLQGLSADALQNLSPEDENRLNQLSDIIQRKLEQARLLKGQ